MTVARRSAPVRVLVTALGWLAEALTVYGQFFGPVPPYVEDDPRYDDEAAHLAYEYRRTWERL